MSVRHAPKRLLSVKLWVGDWRGCTRKVQGEVRDRALASRGNVEDPASGGVAFKGMYLASGAHDSNLRHG